MRTVTAWALYWLGDLVCRIQGILPDDWRIQGWLYRYAYNPLMNWSSEVQGDGSGPWSTVK